MTAHIVIQLSSDDRGYFHVYGESVGDSKEECLVLAQMVAKAFSEGRETYFRARPEADSYFDFDTKVPIHKGFVRFTFVDHSGPHHDQDNMIGFSLGNA